MRNVGKKMLLGLALVACSATAFAASEITTTINGIDANAVKAFDSRIPSGAWGMQVTTIDNDSETISCDGQPTCPKQINEGQTITIKAKTTDWTTPYHQIEMISPAFAGPNGTECHDYILYTIKGDESVQFSVGQLFPFDSQIGTNVGGVCAKVAK